MHQQGTPLAIREWQRGQPLADAKEIFRASIAGTWAVGENILRAANGMVQAVLFTEIGYEPASWVRYAESDPPRRTTLPSDRAGGGGAPGLVNDEYVLSLGQDWKIGGRTWSAGSVVSIPLAEITRPEPTIHLVMDAAPRQRVQSMTYTSEGVLIHTSRNLVAHLSKFTFASGKWRHVDIPLPERGNGTLAMNFANPAEKTAFYLWQSFTQPISLYALDSSSDHMQRLTALPVLFDSSMYKTELLEATAEDGTRIPYFVVRSKKFKYDGRAPTLLHDYGFLGGARIYPPTPPRSGGCGSSRGASTCCPISAAMVPSDLSGGSRDRTSITRMKTS